MLDDRKREVLRAIVEDYVSMREPVGSKALVERHTLGVSSATVRNDMAVLEDEGYIMQPHTSAGRIPTDKGYRLFVDGLAGIRPLRRAEKSAISTFLQGAVDLDDVVHRGVRLLAQLTKQVAIMQYPTLSRSTVRHIEIVTLTDTRLLLVVITSSGRVEQRVVETREPLHEDFIADLRARFNVAAVGKSLAEATEGITAVVNDVPVESQGEATHLVAVMAEAVTDNRTDEKVVIGGTANLLQFGSEFDASFQPLLEALEEHVVLLRLLGEATHSSEVTVRIGHEVPYDTLAATSVVSSGYGPGDQPVGTLGIVGPTRMDYPGSMAAVHAVSRYVSKLVGEG